MQILRLQEDLQSFTPRSASSSKDTAIRAGGNRGFPLVPKQASSPVAGPDSNGNRLWDLLQDNQRQVVLNPAGCYSCAMGLPEPGRWFDSGRDSVIGRRGRKAVWCPSAILLLACGQPEAKDGYLGVSASGTLALRETDSLYVGQPGNFAQSPDGYLYVVDRFSRRVIRYRADGQADGVFGAPGRGPGEAMTPTLILFPNDSNVILTDFAEQRADVFDRVTSTFRRRVRFDGYVVSAEARADTVWLGLYAPTRRTGVGVWPLTTDSIWHGVPFPGIYKPGARVTASEVGVNVGLMGDSLLVAYSATEPILVVDRTGTVVDSFIVPARRRRGFPRDWSPDQEFGKAVAGKSTLFWLRRRTDGMFWAVHYDQTHIRNTLQATIYASLLKPDLSAACIDAVIPTSGEVRAMVLPRGDSLLVLDQRSIGATRLETTVSRYVADTSHCQWVSTRPWASREHRP